MGVDESYVYWDSGNFFSNIQLLTRRKPRTGVKILIIEQMAFFFSCQHVQDQCVILKQTQWHLYENNVYFLPYNLLHD